MKDSKTVYNETRLRNLKRASLKFKEKQLELQIKKGYDDKIINQTRKEIQLLQSEIKNLTS